MSADAVWQAAENQYQLRLKKLDDPEWVPELPPGRRFSSLLVIAIGVLLFATGALFLLLYFSASDEEISGTFLLIAFGCLVPALGALLWRVGTSPARKGWKPEATVKQAGAVRYTTA
jgi:putative copper export protein